MSKGSWKRPVFVSHEKYSENWDRAFGKKHDGNLRGMKGKRFPITEDSKLSEARDIDKEMDGTPAKKVR